MEARVEAAINNALARRFSAHVRTQIRDGSARVVTNLAAALLERDPAVRAALSDNALRLAATAVAAENALKQMRWKRKAARASARLARREK